MKNEKTGIKSNPEESASVDEQVREKNKRRN
jgi:hypothetical protein